ncbi:diguanylate cyclase [Paenibacillus antri]|uniref:Diguanylate cyclase n=1 Tax=Paenibacillus antri TaxID=2582848 RepID=A0A5R9FZH2_9BACL|nr:diguanylate cyclase [Paenibacillus antri]TLS49462.1 diguanylate cyclase [Paenibacillus antri]
MIHIGSLYYRYRSEDSRALASEKALLGVACGAAGIVLMFYTVRISDTTILDARHIAIVLAASQGGLIASAVCGVMIALFRLVFFGVSTTALLAAANVIFYAIVCGYLSKLRWSRLRKYLAMSAVAVGSTLLVFGIVLPKEMLWYTWLMYIGFSAGGGVLVYFLMENIIVSDLLFQRFKQQSTTDFLTGLNNVRRFDKALNECIRSAMQRGERLSLLMIDIDFFKSINDTYGHKAGDDVLRELGGVLLQTCRSVDTVSRNGGEEFSVLLPDCTIERAVEVAERIRHAVEAHAFPIEGGQSLRITVSIGAATFPDMMTRSDELLQMADDGLYQAKRSGRNRVCVAS